MSRVTNFLINTTPPNIHHQLNAAETIGNAFLSPLAHAGGTFSIKKKEGESGLLQKIGAVALIIITAPLSIVGIILKGCGQIWPHKKIHVTDVDATSIRLASPQRVAECYDQITIFNRVCLENNFVDAKGIPRFMMCGGTALGSERHGGMIPWDDDVDIIIFDEERFLALQDKFKEAGLELDSKLRFNSMHKLKFTKEKFQELYPNADYSSQAELDVFVWAKMADGSYTHDTRYARSNWPNDYLTKEQMAEGFELKPFGPLQLPGIKSQAKYLKRFYGENCLTHGIETHGHTKICGIVIPFAKFGAHFFEIQRYKNCVYPRGSRDVTQSPTLRSTQHPKRPSLTQSRLQPFVFSEYCAYTRGSRSIRKPYVFSPVKRSESLFLTQVQRPNPFLFGNTPQNRAVQRNFFITS